MVGVAAMCEEAMFDVFLLRLCIVNEQYIDTKSLSNTREREKKERRERARERGIDWALVVQG